MNVTPQTVFSLIFCTVIISIATNVFGETSYNVIHERVQLGYYNASFTSEDPVFKFFKINRTSFALNASFVLGHDIADGSVMVKLTVDKLYGNEYKRTGSFFTANLCKVFKTNAFGIPDQIKKHGNIEVCHVSKKRYYIYNFIPDTSMLPKFLPYGSYILNIDIYIMNGATLFTLNWFARVEKKI